MSKASDKKEETKKKKDKKLAEEVTTNGMLMVSASMAVRYRPEKFKHLIGQSSIVDQFKGILKTKKMPGTILISGKTGSGKTTAARVFARYVNCATFNACGTCPSCLINIEDHPDYMEINTAETGGKDDAKELIRKAKYMPRFNVRVIMLDEFHNASPAAFQTFLKPLEEPPAKTVWIIATTNPEKLPLAVQNRALNLPLKVISPEMVSERIVEIAKLEGMDLDNKQGRKLAMSIAGYSNGEVRRAISILESVVLTYHGNKNSNLDDTVTKFAALMEAEVGKTSVKLLLSVFKRSAKGMLACSSKVSSCRALLINTRWFVTSLLEEYAGVLAFQSYGYRDLKKQMKDEKISTDTAVLIPFMFKLLSKLNDLEMKMNTNLDDKMVFIAGMGEFMLENKYSKK